MIHMFYYYYYYFTSFWTLVIKDAELILLLIEWDIEDKQPLSIFWYPVLFLLLSLLLFLLFMLLLLFLIVVTNIIISVFIHFMFMFMLVYFFVEKVLSTFCTWLLRFLEMLSNSPNMWLFRFFFIGLRSSSGGG